MIFWEYNKECKNNEWWITKEKYESKKELQHLRDVKRNKENREYFNSHRRKNPDSHRKSNQQYRKKNPEKYRLYRKKWEQNNPQNALSRNAKRRSVKLLATEKTHNFEIENVMRGICRRLKLCLGIQWDLDHIIPLASGGKHHHLNLQPLPHSLNCKKGMNKNFNLPDCYKKAVDMI